MSKDLNIIKQFESADKEEFKRPDHTDFMTSSELRAKEFSGVRLNSITQNQELWIRGIIKLSMPLAQVPHQWDKQYAEIFGLYEVETVSQKGN